MGMNGKHMGGDFVNTTTTTTNNSNNSNSNNNGIGSPKVDQGGELPYAFDTTAPFNIYDEKDASGMARGGGGGGYPNGAAGQAQSFAGGPYGYQNYSMVPDDLGNEEDGMLSTYLT